MLEAVLPSPQARPAKPSLAGVGVAPLDVDPRHCPLAACGAVSAPPQPSHGSPGSPGAAGAAARAAPLRRFPAPPPHFRRRPAPPRPWGAEAAAEAAAPARPGRPLPMGCGAAGHGAVRGPPSPG